MNKAKDSPFGDLTMTISNNELALIIKKHGTEISATIPILQDIQEIYRYLPFQALQYVSQKTGIPSSNLYGVATFYSQFRLSPVGKHIIKACHGTACHVAGATGITESLSDSLDISVGGTTEDGEFTLEAVACLGCCSLAPVIMIDDITYGRLTRSKAPKVAEEHLCKCRSKETKDLAEGFEWKPPTKTNIEKILVGLGSCGIASGAADIYDFFSSLMKKNHLTTEVVVTGCQGMCHNEPIIELITDKNESYTYSSVDIERAKRIATEHIGHGNIIKEWIIDKNDTKTSGGRFFAKQKRIVLENCGSIDPEALEDYVKVGGYSALKKALLNMKPEDVINEVTISGLRGRGGAGFPTGTKWKFAREARGDKKYIICNADEGDPGAFMDRSVLESDPHRVLEGMAIAAYAIGSDEAYIYVRAEYPLAVKRLHKAIKDASNAKYLGKNILGTDFSFNLHIKEGAGAFVCGEETALIASIEGKRGMPRIRPPFPAQSGLWSKPTNINNVETLANIPWIINNGGAAFASCGTEKSKGTKVFALAGKIKNGGLVEVPMGISLREIIEDVGGGTSSGLPLKAVQLGGPSGGCIPAELMNTPVDYDAVNATGAIMGSGGMVVMDTETCMVDVARFFLDFTQKESCGKCTFCRIGTKRMLEALTRICDGLGTDHDLELLRDLSSKIKSTSLCGLGQTAPNPVLTTLKYFGDEYEAHIKDKKCPAGVCRALIEFSISAEKCIGCGACIRACSVKAISGEKKVAHVIDKTLCTKCGACFNTCKFGAITKK